MTDSTIDRLTRLTNQGLGKKIAVQLGLPRPSILRRYTPGQPLLEGPAAVGAVGSGPNVTAIEQILGEAGADKVTASAGMQYAVKPAALVLDASGARTLDQLEELRAVLVPALKALDRNGRLVVLGTPPAELEDAEAASTQQALEGITRSLGKELRAGGTANLLWISEDAHGDAAVLASPLRFLLSSRSAYVSGQPIRVLSAQAAAPADWAAPLAGEVAVITGAARGIGAEIARVFARAGADVIAVDVPAAGEALATVTNEIGGTALQLDVTAPDAGARIAEAVTRRGGVLDVIVHNAGITRDKLFVNTDEQRWGSVLEVNLRSQFRMNEVLLDPGTRGGLRDGGRIVSVASISGIGGNRGQANYAASKAGVIGLVRQLSRQLAERRITVNAVAPGFIETEMTARIPIATREVGRRLNSLLQGGQPVDVAETIAFFAEPGSSGVTGQVVRVCGQSQLGA